MPLENRFKPLTPNDAIDLCHYQEALDFVFSSDKIRNIAITGSYGSGKSSVIRSYENIHKEQTFIHISLARFEEQGQPTSDSADRAKTVNILEGKIINQLLHQIPEENLPPSYTQQQGRISWVHHLLMVLAILALSVCGIYVFQFQKWSYAVSNLDESWIKPFLLATTNPYGRLIGIVLLLILLGSGMFYVLRTYPFRILFKKVDLKGLVGIELFSAEDDTYFDKYLHNVLYLFDQASADAIIFEDLDRYDVTLIFEKLREISDLAYSREKRGLRQEKKPLRFFYLIRDDVFTASDRSKFFDFIIPVVPYVDASNSCDQLLQRFAEAGFASIFSKRFLQDVSLYLGDMRLVSNIVNEYIVYCGRLSNSGLATKPDRQLAMVIYKNLYPGDFDLLQKGRGYVYTLFKQKNLLLKPKKVRLDARIQELRCRLDDAENETLKSMDELNALFFPLSESGIIIAGSATSNLSRTELIHQILENPTEVKYTYYKKEYYYNSAYTSTTASLDVEAKRTEMEANEEYIRRKAHIEAQGTQWQKEATEEILRLQRTQAELASMNLCEILIDFEEDAFWSPQLPAYEPENYLAKIQTSKNFSLLKYLVRNGYIDENYAAYISYFYPNSLTVRDRNFLLSIADRTPMEYDYRLDRPDAVLDRLEQADFSRKEVWNFDLLAYLLRTGGPNLKAFLHNSKKDDGAHLFFAGFWRTGRKSTRAFRFIRALYREHPEWFRMWCETEWVLLKGEWRSFILDAFYFLSPEHLKRINSEDWLTQKISADPEFLQLDCPNVRRLIPALKALNVRFSQIDYREEDIPLIKEIYRENLYMLNLSMLKTAMAVFWDASPTEVESCSYSFIFYHPKEPLSLRVLGELDVYANTVLHECNARFSDTESAAIDFLNRESLSELYKEEYIQRSDTVLRDINTVATRTLWPTLIKNQCVAYTWQNIADYFAEFGKGTNRLPSELVTFINNGRKRLGWNYSQLAQRIGDQASKLCQAILVNQNLSLDRYQTALTSLNISYRSTPFPFTEIPDERMKIVLNLEIVPVTVQNAAVIRENYPQLWNDFILPNGAKKLTELMDTKEIQLTESELARLLEDFRMTDSIAEKMLSIFSETISLQHRTFSDAVRVRIVEAHFNPKEIPFMLKSFGQESPGVRTAFLDYTRGHADSVADAAVHTQFIPTEVYAVCLKGLTQGQLLTLRPYLANSNFEIVCTKNKKPKFPDTPEVRSILNAFKAYRWISSWRIRDGKIIAYPTRK